MRQFRSQPMMFVGAEGMHYIAAEGRRVLDAMAGLWCVNAGHAQPRIVEAIREAAGRLDFVSSFKMSHPGAFELAPTPDGCRSRRARPCVLHQFRLGSGRHGSEDRPRLSPGSRRCGPHQADRARQRLSRHGLWRPVRRRYRSPQARISGRCCRMSRTSRCPMTARPWPSRAASLEPARTTRMNSKRCCR